MYITRLDKNLFKRMMDVGRAFRLIYSVAIKFLHNHISITYESLGLKYLHVHVGLKHLGQLLTVFYNPYYKSINLKSKANELIAKLKQ